MAVTSTHARAGKPAPDAAHTGAHLESCLRSAVLLVGLKCVTIVLVPSLMDC